MRWQRLWAGILGFGFMVVGVLRFIQVDAMLDLSVAQPIHGLIHLVTGAALLGGALWDRGSHAEVTNRWIGVFYVALGHGRGLAGPFNSKLLLLAPAWRKFAALALTLVILDRSPLVPALLFLCSFVLSGWAAWPCNNGFLKQRHSRK